MSDYRMGKNVKRAIEEAHRAVSPESFLSIEMLEILLSYYFWQKIPSDLNSDNTLENSRILKFSQLLFDDIILRLCKFKDDDSRSLSFDQVAKELRKRSSMRDRVEGIEPLIKEYKTITQNIENHRNTRVTHLAKRNRTYLKPPTEIREAIQLALQIIDKLSGDRINYMLEGMQLRNVTLSANSWNEEGL